MEICKKAYARISILSKLKYVEMKMEDLLTVYKTFIRCIVEYCCVVLYGTLLSQFTKTMPLNGYIEFA